MRARWARGVDGWGPAGFGFMFESQQQTFSTQDSQTTPSVTTGGSVCVVLAFRATVPGRQRSVLLEAHGLDVCRWLHKPVPKSAQGATLPIVTSRATAASAASSRAEQIPLCATCLPFPAAPRNLSFQLEALDPVWRAPAGAAGRPSHPFSASPDTPATSKRALCAAARAHPLLRWLLHVPGLSGGFECFQFPGSPLEAITSIPLCKGNERGGRKG